MKIICRPIVLGQALQSVSRAIASRTTLPILNNVLLETFHDGLAITATNLELGIRKVIPAAVLEEGATTAPARLLTDFAGSLPDSDLTMELDASTSNLSLRCDRFDTHVKCIEAEEFPPGPKADDGERMMVALDELLHAVDQTQMAASTDEARPVLTGELLHVRGSHLTLVATDGHRLAERKLEVDNPNPDTDLRLIVPARALAELGRVFRGEEDKVELMVSASKNQIFFRAGRSELNSRLIDGTYPNYSQVIPTSNSTVVRASLPEFTQTVKAVSLFARDNANVVKIKAGAGTVLMTATTNEVGDSRAELVADVEGEEIQIAFNARYLLDALGALEGERVEFLFDGPLSPGLIKSPESDLYQYVIMPIRVAM